MNSDTCLDHRQLRQFLVRELSGAELDQSKQHLAKCTGCLDRLMQLRRELDAEEAFSAPSAAPGFLKVRAKELYRPGAEDQSSAKTRDLGLVDTVVSKLGGFLGSFFDLLTVKEWAVASVALLLVASGLVISTLDVNPPDLRPQGHLAPWTRGVQFYPQGMVSSFDGTFRWEAAGTAQLYVLQLYEDGHNLIWESKAIVATEMPLPEAMQRQLLALGSFSWRVTALSSPGRVLGESEMIEVELAK